MPVAVSNLQRRRISPPRLHAVARRTLAALGTSAVFTVLAQSKYDESGPHCAADNRCDATGVALRDDAFSRGAVATVGFVAGLVGVGAGAVLYLTAPKRGGTAFSAAPVIGFRSSGVAVKAVW